jgi:hypothetical protein
MKHYAIFLMLFSTLLAASCTPVAEAPPIYITVRVDGREQVYSYNQPVTVAQFLREIDVERGPLDRIEPPDVTQISNEMVITITRIVEEEECVEEMIPPESDERLMEGLEPGEEVILQTGREGVRRVCFRVTLANGQVEARVETRRDEIQPVQNEIIGIGPTTQLDPVPVVGTLAYINNGSAWIIQGSSSQRRPLSAVSGLDSRVFSLSNDGRMLLYTVEAIESEGDSAFNRLMLISDISQIDPTPIALRWQDVLYADWVPGEANRISFSLGETSLTGGGWLAYNDLWTMRIDPLTGEAFDLEEVLPRSALGLFSWWGTNFKWSPDGQRLAYVNAEAVGLVDFENRQFGPPLLSFAHFTTSNEWAWLTTVSWTPDSQLLTTTVHGDPIGNETPEDSPVFHVAVAAADATFAAESVVARAGIWSAPQFSPAIPAEGQPFPRVRLAYLRAREWDDSFTGQYDLIVADRDGSNARTVFPPSGQPGLRAQTFAWSPDGRQIAFIYNGNLWVVDVETDLSDQLTLDGGASRPVWTR